MPTFYTISSVREDIKKYKKCDSYLRCCNDLCSYFKDRDTETIYSHPYLISEGNNWRFIKSRLENSNSGKGKSNGYRLYYFVDRTTEEVILLGFYPKVGKYGQSDLTKTEIKKILNTFRTERDNRQLVVHDIVNDFVAQEA